MYILKQKFFLSLDEYYSESSDEETHPSAATSVESLDNIGHTSGRSLEKNYAKSNPLMLLRHT